MATQQFWQHRTSGEVYAVEISDDNEATGVCGPLNRREVKRSELGNYDCPAFDAAGLDILDEMARHENEYRILGDDEIAAIEDQYA